jgi:hypothetical protein
MPDVPQAQIYRGMPHLLVSDGVRHSLGWQDRKAGPSFVIARLDRLETTRVIMRFPLTEQGWADAWQALCEIDASAAAAIDASLAQLRASGRVAAELTSLDSESLCTLRHVTMSGGSYRLPLAYHQAYDLRFMADRVIICPPSSREASVEVPYRDVEAVEVSGPGVVSRPPAELLAWISALGLLGAFVGFLVNHLPGSLLGAVLFAMVGGLVGAASIKIETIVRLRWRDAELSFLHSQMRPEALRTQLAPALLAIRNASTAQAGSAPGSIPDQLSQLASLLQQDLITRDEFEQLKAQLSSPGGQPPA